MSEHRVSIANSWPALLIVLVLATNTSTGCEAPARTGRMPRPAQTAALTKPSDDSPTGDGQASCHSNKRWHLDLGIRNSYPKLDSAQKQLNLRMDVPLMFDVFGVFDRPYTPIDRRSDQGYTSLYGGIGRQENTRFLWTYYFGGSSGKDINHGRFLLQTLEVDFKYHFYYTGVSAEYYPWEIPSIHATPSWEQRLLASRPFLLAGLESGYVGSKGEGDYRIAGITAYHRRAQDS